MAKRMLIDATHHEETRVVVMDGNKLTEFDYESQFRRQLKGNIFLAKITRVEPGLQAAFINFGGNRHGFLPFAEIHPDYYRIPVADREALIAEQQAMEEAARAADAADDMDDDSGFDPETDQESDALSFDDGADQDGQEDTNEIPDQNTTEVAEFDQDEPAVGALTDRDDMSDSSETELQKETADQVAETDDQDSNASFEGDDNQNDDTSPDDQQNTDGQNGSDRGPRRGWRRGSGGRYGRGGQKDGRNGHHGGGRYMGARAKRDEISDEGPMGLHARFRRKYKIQEVIKRGQIMLIQVSKEERGNKGAAVTTYLSLPGRYCVLMPNSPRGGGVSRKIDNFADRRRLKSMLRALEIPSGMSVILRTAGVERAEADIKRDYDYLLRLWNNIRELTLQSTAPASIYEEGDLIKRSIRDIYTDDIEDITVSGERGFKETRDFMGLLMPTHVDQVIEYKNDKIPLFQRYQVEGQINSIGEPIVQLKSGGYIVINQTEALVAVDVNSGRSTRERHIEETALKTNLEAAEEVARQLRLRDLGGLVVIDFIDMEDRRNNMKVERRLKDALSTDRARIQVNRISSFGLLELSRQRLNPSLTEAQFQKCPHCEGFGYIRSVDSAAIMALRSLEEEGVRARTARVALHIPNAIALYILNSKRDMLADIEKRYAFKVMMNVDETLAPSGFRVEALRDVVVSDDDQEVGDEGADGPTGGDDAPKTPRVPRRNKKPVLMEQALETEPALVDAAHDPSNGFDDDDAPQTDENFNRPDVEPDSELNRIPGPARGPRRHHTGKSGPRDGPRGSGRNGSGHDQNRDGGNSGGGARGGRPRNNRNNRDQNRGPRNHARGDMNAKPAGYSNDDLVAPPRSYESNEPPASGYGSVAAGSGPAGNNRPAADQKSGATYFVAKRRVPIDQPVPSTESHGRSEQTGASSAATAPIEARYAPSSTSSGASSPSSSDGPKKKGWWSKFS